MFRSLMVRSLILLLPLCMGSPFVQAQTSGPQDPPPGPGGGDPGGGGGGDGTAATGNLQGVPSASSHIRLRFGQVDAVSGDISMSVPLGPRLPGRIPLGFTWNYELASGEGQYGSAVYPISWPSPEVPNPQITMWFNGSQLRFLKEAAPRLGLPSAAMVSDWLRKRHVPETLLSRFTSGAKVYGSADGTRFLIVSGAAPTAMAVLDGDNAIWTANALADYRITNVTNLWGDEVIIAEWDFLSFSEFPSTVTCKALPRGVVIRNERNHSHSITFTITSRGTYYCPSEFQVSNSMGHPTVTASGVLRATQRRYLKPSGTINTVGGPVPSYQEVFLPSADCHFLPQRLTLTASDGSSQATVFDWYTAVANVSAPDGPCGSYVGGQLLVTYPLDRPASIAHHDGLVESFEFTITPALAGSSFDMITGIWKGWGPTQPEYNSLANPSLGVSKVTFTGAGVDQSVWIPRALPLSFFNTTTMTRSWPQPKHETFVLYFPTSQPTSGTPYRGVRLTHPDGGSWGATTDAQAYLFATSAIVKAESIHGTGIPSLATSQPFTYIPPTAYTVYDTTSYENWELRSWGNPSGGLNLPVNAQPTRITRRPVGLPEEVKLLGEWDDYGPTRTDSETWLSGAAGPAPTGNKVAAWGAMVVGASSARIHRMSKITRHWDNALGALFTDTERSTLDGSDLPALRGVASVDFGTTTTHRDSLGRVDSVTGVTGAFTATETCSYESGLPLVNDITKALTDGATTYAANPDNSSVKAGSTATYDSTPFRWPLSQTDKVDGRPATFLLRDSLGRPTQTQAPDGSIVDTSYDAWGRVDSVTRRSRSDASGTVEAVTTTYEYDTANRIKTETVSTGGRNLTTRTYLDGFGRVVRVDLPGNKYQETGYDGFGQKHWQTPVLVAGQTRYGFSTWAYDAQGRFTETRDPKTRLLTKVLQQPAWGTIVKDGKTLTGVIHTVQDDRGYTRSTVTDLLGQKAAVVDQKDQVTEYFYDKNGRLKRTEQGAQQRHYSYNDMGWLLSRIEPEEGTTTYSRFNLMGAPTRTRLSGRLGGSQADTELTLDAHLRPSRIRATWAADPSAVVDRTITYYDAFHVPQSVIEVQPRGTLTETYGVDAAGRLISKTVSDGTQSFTIQRTLDALGNPLDLTYPAGGGRAPQLLTIAYDDALRPSELTLDGARRAHMDYDQVSGAAVSQVLTLGPEGSAVKSTSKVDWGELTQVIHAYAGGSDAFDLAWTAGGLMTQRGSDTFFYDELQRLKEANTAGAPGTPQAGKVLTQKFAYDRYGNRIWNWAGITSGTVADAAPEVRNWSVSNDPTHSLETNNSLPPTLTALGGEGGNTATGNLSTGALYDDLGRLTRVYAIPGASSSQMAWAYDALGRVISENGTTFLLDGEGLRFKRMKEDGSVQYTVYGFGREPLSVFSKPAPTAGGGGNLWQGAQSAILTANSGGWDGMHYTIPCVAGDVFSGECYARTVGMGPGNAILGVRFDSDTQIAIDWASWGVTNGTSRVRLTTLGVAPAGATKALVFINVGPCNPGAQGIFEGIAFWRGARPNPYLWQGTPNVTLTAGSNGWDGLDYTIPCVAGDTFSGECNARAIGMGPGNAILGVRFDSDTQIGIGWAGSGVTSGTSLVRLTTQGVAPAGATKALVFINVGPCNPGAQGIFEALAFWRGLGSNPASLVFERSMVYGFGGLVSEEGPTGPVYVQGDQVGSPNILTNASGAVVGRSKNLPFGERFGSVGYRSNRRYTNHEETEDYAIYMQARTYLPAYGKFAQVDPAYDQTKDDPESWNLYNYVTNNPITRTDPDGRNSRDNPLHAAWRNSDHYQQGIAGVKDAFKAGGGIGFIASGNNAGAFAKWKEFDGSGVVKLPDMSAAGWVAQTNIDHAPGAQNPETYSTIADKQPDRKVFSGENAIKSAVEYGFTFIQNNFDTKVREYGFLVYKAGDGYTISPIIRGAPMATDYSVAYSSIPKGSLVVGNAHTHPIIMPRERVAANGDDLRNVRIKRTWGMRDGLNFSRNYKGYLQNATDPKSVLSYWGPAYSGSGPYNYQQVSYDAWTYR